jgi:glycosyltransferase involved in cell wall biosynthesis
MPITRLTVAICTWNRCVLLEQTLQQMTQLESPPNVVWELLVVNNNCTDDTDAVIGRFAGRLPLRRVFEPVPGLSNARNRAVSEATGDYMIWTDDDVLVSREWLVEYAHGFERHPEGTVFGGPVAPWFPNSPPGWLTEAWPTVFAAYACINHGDDEIQLTHRKLPFGANMAMRMDHQRALAYDPNRGVTPGRRMGGEEIDVVRRSLDMGGTSWWLPKARVKHYIPEARQTLSYLRRYFHADGEHIGRYEGETLVDGYPTLLGRPRWLWRIAVEAEFRYRMLRWFRPATAWMADLITASTSWGKLRGLASRGRVPVNGTARAE